MIDEKLALDAAIEHFDGDDLAANVWMGKYALRNDKGELMEGTPTETMTRLSDEFARIEQNYPNPLSKDEISSLLESWTVVPQGSPMSAIGNPYQVQSLSNCFVIPSPFDSYGGILKADQDLVQIMKRRGGVGVDISTIRPRGMRTTNAAGTTDGIGIFMERFSNSCREVAQGGRRGALMLSIGLHPELETFINIKKDKKKVTGANVSVRVSDEFMKAVEKDAKFTLQWPLDVPLNDAKVTKVVKAKLIWDQLIDANWSSAEPGIMFWDTMINNNMADIFSDKGFSTTSSNPCGEIGLCPYDSCRLLLVNLTKFVKDPFTKKAKFDHEKFTIVVRKAQRLMDDLVDLEIEAVNKIIAKIDADKEPSNIKQQERDLWSDVLKMAWGGRRTGLGITGLGDAIAYLNVKYGSERSIEITEEIYKNLALSSHAESVNLAKERGAFPAFDVEHYERNKTTHPFLKRLIENSSYQTNVDLFKHGRRNIALTTTAPAGSMSILTRTTSGCEPVFMLSYKRRKKINQNDVDTNVDFVDDMGDKWTEFIVHHHGLKKWIEITGETDVTKSPYHGATSTDIDWKRSVELQATAQRWVEHSISKTCNVPSTITKEQVSDLYIHAWKLGCKGFTIYREGSRSGVLVSDATKKPMIIDNHAPKRPKELECDIHRTVVKGERYMVLVGLLEGKPYEIFCGLSETVEIPKKRTKGVLVKMAKGKDGLSPYNLRIPLADDDEIVVKDIVKTFDNPMYGSMTRTLSLALRHGVPVQYVCEQIKKDRHEDITSFSAAMSRILGKNYVLDGTKVTTEKNCPDCKSTNLIYQNGCISCSSCAWSRCG